MIKKIDRNKYTDYRWGIKQVAGVIKDMMDKQDEIIDALNKKKKE